MTYDVANFCGYDTTLNQLDVFEEPSIYLGT